MCSWLDRTNIKTETESRLEIKSISTILVLRIMLWEQRAFFLNSNLYRAAYNWQYFSFNQWKMWMVDEQNIHVFLLLFAIRIFNQNILTEYHPQHWWVRLNSCKWNTRCFYPNCFSHKTSPFMKMLTNKYNL